MGKGHKIYDMYIIRTSGIPIFAGCAGLDFCKNNPSHHDMHSGLFSAIYMFSKEAFSSSDLRIIVYNNMQICFNIDIENDIMIIFIYPINLKRPIIRRHLDKAHQIFIENFLYLVKSQVIDEEAFKKFIELLICDGVIKDPMASIAKMQLNRKDCVAKIDLS